MNLMTDYSSSDEAISEWHLGNNSRIDMTVEDIYGDGLTSLGSPFVLINNKNDVLLIRLTKRHNCFKFWQGCK